MAKAFRPSSLWAAALLSALALSCAALGPPAEIPKVLPVLQRWTGDYPVGQLDRLPEGQRRSRVGCLSDAAAFKRFWQAFKPDTAVPAIDFSKNLVIFARNMDRYHRTLIAKVTLQDGVAEIVDIGTASASPIEDKVGVALALVPREGVQFIRRGKERIPVQ
jgi:hypothetical protein